MDAILESGDCHCYITVDSGLLWILVSQEVTWNSRSWEVWNPIFGALVKQTCILKSDSQGQDFGTWLCYENSIFRISSESLDLKIRHIMVSRLENLKTCLKMQEIWYSFTSGILFHHHRVYFYRPRKLEQSLLLYSDPLL